MTALLQLINISFSHGQKNLFSGLNLNINKRDKIGLVGENGCGKSTLLNLIKGDLELEKGEIRQPNAVSIAVVEQFLPQPLVDLSLLDAVIDVLEADEQVYHGWKAQSQLMTLGFGIEQFSIKVRFLSGGQQNLLLIARALLQEPDLLLLDEPGNHMDILAMSQLQHFLRDDCNCAFMIISHDQYLLNNVCTKTVFLRDKQCSKFELAYAQAKQQLQQQELQARQRLQIEEKEIARLKATAKQLAILGRENDNDKLSRKAKSIEKRAEKLDASKTHTVQESGLKLKFANQILRAKQILSIDYYQVMTPDLSSELLCIERLIISPGDRVAFLGVNGVGKSSTLENIRRAFHQPRDCSAKIGFHEKTQLGYYDQELRQLDQRCSRIDWLRKFCSASEEQLKSALIKAGISYQEFDRCVASLSGGEKARMMFIAFALNQPNLLILDEPTNHIDLQGKQQLTEQLMSSGATLLITSHDRFFLQQIATRWLWIDSGKLREVNSDEPFYQALFSPTKATKQTNIADINLCPLLLTGQESEQLILQRIDMLERKLQLDQQQKPKRQKPRLQQQWQSELDQLWQSIT
ncbi:MAG: ATP-binding cassette domain-containing protein [Pseudomonadales bacterium]|nr:ATP-binding cassette domain-containing protein [Pseudomonadales bacterium]NRA14397.1 ABC-F family ATP-binding cassette domain-containing protein [Oceanospirillaceae bacterium]